VNKMKDIQEKTEWDRIYFPEQKDKLISKGITSLEKLAQISEIQKLSKPILLGETYHHFVSLGVGEYINENDLLFLVNEGIQERYFQTEKSKIFGFIPCSKYVRKERIITKDDFSSIVKKYRLSPSKIDELRNDLQF
jgi:hypothetical protein